MSEGLNTKHCNDNLSPLLDARRSKYEILQ